MGTIVGSILLLVIAAGIVVGSFVGKKAVVSLTAIVPVIIAGAVFFAGGYHTVPTRNVGVVSQYGKVLNEYSPGAHWLWPTKSVNNVPITIQSDNFSQANGVGSDQYNNSGATGYCITVRLGGQQQGCADVQLQTETNASAVPSLYANYSSYGPNLAQDVDRYVVKRDLTTVLNRVLGDYNPVIDVSNQLEACDLSKNTTCNVSTGSQFSAFDPQILSALRQELSNQVTVEDVNLQFIHYDGTTENALTKIQDSYLETAQAFQQEKTNAAQASANAALNSGGGLSQAVLQNECYTTTQDAIKSGYQLPTGWSCTGSSSSLILPGSK